VQRLNRIGHSEGDPCVALDHQFSSKDDAGD